MVNYILSTANRHAQWAGLHREPEAREIHGDTTPNTAPETAAVLQEQAVE